MKIDLLGASNIALSFYKDITGMYRTSTEVNLTTVLSENPEFIVEPYVGFTIARNDINETTYLDYLELLQGGDVLFIQGAGNDYGACVKIGDIDSVDCDSYYGALNCVIKTIKSKYKTIILATGFGVKKNEEYRKYNQAIRDIAGKYNLCLVDFEFDKRFNEEETLPDKEHMNEAGLRLYADIITDMLKKFAE